MIGGLAATAPSAQAVGASGIAAGGAGASSCSLSVTCLSFKAGCGTHTVNDLDASIRTAALADGRAHPITWSAKYPEPPNGILMIQPMNAGCVDVGFPIQVGPRSGKSVVFPAGTVHIAVWVNGPFAQLTWRVQDAAS
jgi:hypothetical protein